MQDMKSMRKLHGNKRFFMNRQIPAKIAEEITILRVKDIQKIQKLGTRASESASKILPKLYEQPIINNSLIQKWTGFTRAGSQKVIDRFLEMGILESKNQDKK